MNKLLSSLLFFIVMMLVCVFDKDKFDVYLVIIEVNDKVMLFLVIIKDGKLVY